MATLTFFKPSGFKDADIFRGTYSGPGDSPGEWEFLTRDSKLQSLLRFRVLEFMSSADLPVEYRSRIKKAICLNLRSGNDVESSIDYPVKSKLTSDAIKSWILENLSRVDDGSTGSTEEIHVDEEIPIDDVNNSIVDEEPPTNTPVDETPSTASGENNGSRKGLLIGGGVVFLAVLGFVAGTILSDAYNDPEKDEFGMTDNIWEDEFRTDRPVLVNDNSDDEPVDFSLAWEETPPRCAANETRVEMSRIEKSKIVGGMREPPPDIGF